MPKCHIRSGQFQTKCHKRAETRLNGAQARFLKGEKHCDTYDGPAPKHEASVALLAIPYVIRRGFAKKPGLHFPLPNLKSDKTASTKEKEGKKETEVPV